MVLFKLETKGNQFSFYATASDHDHCQLLNFLNSLESKYRASRKALFVFFDKISIDGPIRNTDKSHKLNDIWEFIEGDLRIFYFYDAGKIIICTHGIIKKGRKTPKGDIRHGEKIREEYLGSKKIAPLEIFELSDEGKNEKENF